MGERLVVEIKRNDSRIATVYYHWSAYTKPAAHIVNLMQNHVLHNADSLTDDQLQLALIRFSENMLMCGYVGEEEAKESIFAEIQQVLDRSDDSVQGMMEDLLLAHGGLNHTDLERAMAKFPGEIFLDDANRNEGLVNIFPDSMKNAVSWAQGLVTIDLDAKRVYNGMAYEYTWEEYLDECQENGESPIPIDEMEQLPVDLSDYGLDQTGIVDEILSLTTDTWLVFGDKIFQLKDG